MSENNKHPDLSEQAKIRREKLANLQEEGRDPFVITKYDQTHHSEEIKENFTKLNGRNVSIAGHYSDRKSVV